MATKRKKTTERKATAARVATIDRAKLQEARLSAKRTSARRYPWDGHNPEGPREPTTIRFNSYERKLLAYVGAWKGLSMQKLIVELALEAAREAVDEVENPKRARKAPVIVRAG